MSEEILRERPWVTIEGTRYAIRRLGLPDVFSLARMLAQIQLSTASDVDVFMQDELDSEGQPTGERKVNAIALLFALSAGIPEIEDEFYGWVAGMLVCEDGDPVLVSDVTDPEKFPIEAWPEIIEKIVTMPEIGSFFDRVRTLARNQELRSLLQRKSGQSNARPAGPTSKSSGSRSRGSSKSSTKKRGSGGTN